jgi:hypothetical protein
MGSQNGALLPCCPFQYGQNGQSSPTGKSSPSSWGQPMFWSVAATDLTPCWVKNSSIPFCRPRSVTSTRNISCRSEDVTVVISHPFRPEPSTTSGHAAEVVRMYAALNEEDPRNEKSDIVSPRVCQSRAIVSRGDKTGAMRCREKAKPLLRLPRRPFSKY